MTPEQKIVVIAWMSREIHILNGQSRDYAMRGEWDRVEACKRRVDAFSRAVEAVEAQ